MRKFILPLLISFSFLSAMTILGEKGKNTFNFHVGRANSYYNIRSYEFEGAYTFNFGLQIGAGYQYSHDDLWTIEFVEESWYSRYNGNISFSLLDHNKWNFPMDIWITTQYYYDDYHTDSFSKVENGIVYGLALKRNFQIFNHFEMIPQLSAEHLLFKRIGIGAEDGYGETFMLTPEVSIRYRFLYAYVKYVLFAPIAGLSNHQFSNSNIHVGIGIVIN